MSDTERLRRVLAAIEELDCECDGEYVGDPPTLRGTVCTKHRILLDSGEAEREYRA